MATVSVIGWVVATCSVIFHFNFRDLQKRDHRVGVASCGRCMQLSLPHLSNNSALYDACGLASGVPPLLEGVLLQCFLRGSLF